MLLIALRDSRLSVNELLLPQSALQVKENFKSTLETAILCGKQNISLRGHHEGYDTEGNPENFLVLQFLKKAGDKLLKSNFHTAGKYARYHSPCIQNELISCCGDWIHECLLQEVVTANSTQFVLMKVQTQPTMSNYH